MNPESMSVPLNQLALVAGLLVASIWLWLACRRWHDRWLHRRRWSRALDAEAHAPRLLEKLGYVVLGSQVEGTYQLIVDGRPTTVSVRADYVVSRDGRLYVAEVKSGRLAPRLDTSATRRQLLEYLIAFEAHGVLLVDGEGRRVHEVVFPVSPRAALKSLPGPRLAWMILGAATAAAFAWMLGPR
jgi:hypothetical protein